MRLHQQPRQIRVPDCLAHPRVEAGRRPEDDVVVFKHDPCDEPRAGLIADVAPLEERFLDRVVTERAERNPVARERWATGDMFRLEPAYYLTRFFKPPRWRNSRPSSDGVLHQFDVSDRIVAMISETPFINDVREDVRLVLREQDRTDVVSFSEPFRHNKRHLARVECGMGPDEAAPSLVEVRTNHYAVRAHCWYEGSLLTRVEREIEDTRLRPGNVTESTLHLAYDEYGQMLRAHIDWGEKAGFPPRILFERDPTVPTLRQAKTLFRNYFTCWLRELLRGLGLQDPVWSVQLVYDTANPILPPFVAVSTEPLRAATLAGAENPLMVWSFPEYPRALLPDAPLDERTMRLARFINHEEPDDRKLIRILRDIAKEMTASRCGGVIETTDDFAVIAIDMTGDDLARALKASVLAETIERYSELGIAGS
jgi:hypothetical protein